MASPEKAKKNTVVRANSNSRSVISASKGKNVFKADISIMKRAGKARGISADGETLKSFAKKLRVPTLSSAKGRSKDPYIGLRPLKRGKK